MNSLLANYSSSGDEGGGDEDEEEQVREEEEEEEEDGSSSSSDDDDDDDVDQSGSSKPPPVGVGTGGGRGGGSKLPSALDLLESTSAPSFLKVPALEEEFTAPTKTKRPPPGREAYSGRGGYNSYGKKPRSTHPEGGSRPTPISAPSAPPPLPPEPRDLAEGGKAPGGKKPGKDKESAKDRVKKQRLKGQAGIGSDFRVWRSEEEMRHRQQYD